MPVQFDPYSFNHKYATVGNYQYHYVDEGNKDGIAIVFVHGFPDLWYGWRHQIQFFAGLGRYRVIAMDLLGFGATSKPRPAKRDDPHPDYSPKSVASQVVGLLDQIGIDKAVFVGHDWGCGVISRVAWHFPERCYNQI
ncbi:hypothetical protein BG004_007279, partial [Podila humilis]